MQARHHLIALATLTLCAQALAQSQPQTGEPTAKLDRIEVTGSIIKRMNAESPSPVTIISRRAIEESGATTIDELLRRVPAVGAGSLNDGVNNSFNSGTSSIGLRGLGSAATLTLLNGRRIGASPVADPNTGRSTIYNLNSIPMAAVERIEILKDGASATYGSDALAGVVNIILRKDFAGLAIDAGTAFNDDGKHQVHRASLAWGVGSPAEQGFNLVATVDVNSRKPVMTADIRGDVHADLYSKYVGTYTPSSSSVPTGNYYTVSGSGSGTFKQAGAGCPSANIIGQGLPLTPPAWTSATSWKAGECRYDVENAEGAERIGAQDRLGGLLRASYRFNPETQLFGELLLSGTKSTYNSVSPSRTEARSVWANSDAKLQTFDGLRLPVGHPDNPFSTTIGLRYRFNDIKAQAVAESKNARLVLGFNTEAAGWDIETALLHHYQTLDSTVKNVITLKGMKDALANRSYRFNGQANSAAVIDALVDDAVTEGVGKYTSLDVRGTRELFQMAGGMAALGAGAEIRREEMDVTPNALLSSGGFIGRGSASASGSRVSGAGYAELALPFVKNLETQAAVRYEYYDDFGSATTGKLGAKYTFNSAVAMRSTYASGFRAPALSQINAGNVASFSNSGNPADPIRCAGAGQTSPSADCSASRSIPAAILANKDLKPETSNSFTFGVLVEPAPGINASVDWFRYDRRNEVNRPSVGDVLRNPDRFPGGIVRNPDPSTWMPGVANSGPIDYVIRQFRNMAQTIVQGYDIDASARLKLPEELGQMDFNLTSTTLIRRDSADLPGDPLESDIGDEDTPKTRASLSARWTSGPWRVNATVNHVEPMRKTSISSNTCKMYTDGGQPELCGIAHWQTLDVGMGYSGFKNLRLSLNIDNITDRRAAYDPISTSDLNNQFHSMRGRYYSLSAKYSY